MRLRANFKLALERLRTDFGQTWGQFRSDSGASLTLDQIQANFGMTSDFAGFVIFLTGVVHTQILKFLAPNAWTQAVAEPWHTVARPHWLKHALVNNKPVKEDPGLAKQREGFRQDMKRL